MTHRPVLEVFDSLVGMDAGQSINSSVDVRQQWSHWFQPEALQTPDADTEHDVDEHESATGDRKY